MSAYAFLWLPFFEWDLLFCVRFLHHWKTSDFPKTAPYYQCKASHALYTTFLSSWSGLAWWSPHWMEIEVTVLVLPGLWVGRLFCSKVPLSESLLQRCFSRGSEGMAQRQGWLSLDNLWEDWGCQWPVQHQGRESLLVLQETWLECERWGGAWAQWWFSKSQFTWSPPKMEPQG